jgi:hypothetical protein
LAPEIGEWMHSGFSLMTALVLFAGVGVVASPHDLLSQQADADRSIASADLPDAPRPQLAATDAGLMPVQADGQQAQAPASTAAPTAGQASAPAGSSSSQAAPPQTDAEKSAHDKAEEQLKQQEKQRVMGVMATFNTTSNQDALPLSPGQKFKLYFKSETDPWPFLLAAVVGGIGQAKDTYPEWGQGLKGYGRRAGAAYADAFIGNFFGNAVLPTLLHEDPRYFQKGKGSVASRILWAAGSTVWCKRDKGTWGPNWSNVGGNLIGAAISDAYYPASQRTVTNTIENGFTVSAEGIVGAELIEFWPDMVRRHNQKQAEKLARQQGAAGQTAKPDPTATPDPNAKDQGAKPDANAK